MIKLTTREAVLFSIAIIETLLDRSDIEENVSNALNEALAILNESVKESTDETTS